MTLISSIITFLAGATTGALTTYFVMRSSFSFSRYWIAGLVTLMWVVSVIVELSVPEYAVPVAVHGLMGVIAGHFFYEKRFGKQ